MAIQSVNTRIKNKHALEVDWLKATNFTPLHGELIIYDAEVDASGDVLTKIVDGEEITLLPDGRATPYTYARFKIGNGVSNVNSLPFIVEAEINNMISWGTSDPDAVTNGQFYFKYSE